eukprot:TRINITY_DN59097_c0_g1_i1.p1 TRINITY_DN59097_c0_g1~~TRINITY_DN59097_c0_g1_i1.p1  ORF type:complete len:437 (-),score=75.96 TRINITY_DN59097_c0_g1_i1:125-1408(-)
MSISVVDRSAIFAAAAASSGTASRRQRPALPQLTAAALAAALIPGSKQLLRVHHGRKFRAAHVLRRARGGQPTQTFRPYIPGVVQSGEEYNVLEPAKDIGTAEQLKSGNTFSKTGPPRSRVVNPKEISTNHDTTTPSLLKRRSLSSSIADVKKIMRGEIKDENYTGLSTGFSCMDQFYRPVRGEVTVVTAPPGSGKSEWMLSLMMNMAKIHGWRVAPCMFEHKPEDLYQALLEKFFEAPHTRIKLFEEKAIDEALDFIQKHVLSIGSKFSEELLIEQILDAASHYANFHREDGGLHGLIIDPYNYITKKLGGASQETNFVAHILIKVKQFAANENCHVWIVVHPTKNSGTAKGEEPSLYDCCGSAHWYNMCDNGIVVQRNKNPDGGSTTMVKLQVAKVRNRFAGEVGQAVLYFDRATRCYSETPDAS